MYLALHDRQAVSGQGHGRGAMKLILDFIKTSPCRKAESARTSSAPENTASRRLYASLVFEEVPEAYDSEDDLIPAALKL